MATETVSKEAELKAQVSELKHKYSESDRARGNLAKELGEAQNQVLKLQSAKKENDALKALVKDRDAQINRLNADLDSARAEQVRAARVLDGLRAFKSVLDSA